MKQRYNHPKPQCPPLSVYISICQYLSRNICKNCKLSLHLYDKKAARCIRTATPSCHSERSEESRFRQVGVTEILRR